MNQSLFNRIYGTDILDIICCSFKKQKKTHDEIESAFDYIIQNKFVPQISQHMRSFADKNRRLNV